MALDALTTGAPPVDADPDVWLRTQFETLGVREAPDLDLLEAEDLLPDPARLTGSPAWEVERTLDEFPRSWRYQDGVYDVQVRALAAKVVLVASNKVAKRAKDPPRHVLPGFRGFSVILSNASREVRLR